MEFSTGSYCTHIFTFYGLGLFYLKAILFALYSSNVIDSEWQRYTAISLNLKSDFRKGNLTGDN